MRSRVLIPWRRTWFYLPQWGTDTGLKRKEKRYLLQFSFACFTDTQHQFLFLLKLATVHTTVVHRSKGEKAADIDTKFFKLMHISVLIYFFSSDVVGSIVWRTSEVVRKRNQWAAGAKLGCAIHLQPAECNRWKWSNSVKWKKMTTAYTQPHRINRACYFTFSFYTDIILLKLYPRRTKRINTTRSAARPHPRTGTQD